MNDLVEFAKRIEGELRSASREPHWDAREAERYMIDIDSRRKLFMDRASQLAATIIQPRMEVLCSYFANAGQAKDESDFPRARSSLWLSSTMCGSRRSSLPTLLRWSLNS